MTKTRIGESEIEERAMSRLLAPETLLPIQFFDGRRGDDPSMHATKRLMLAVLEDAFRCLQSYTLAHTPLARRSYVETQAWIADRSAHGPFAFETICEALGIEPNRLRQGIRDWCSQISSGANHRRLKRRSIGRQPGPLRTGQRRRRRRRN